MIEELIGSMREAVSAIRTLPTREVTIFHHNDTDGLSSGAILLTAFESIGYSVNRFSLEKPYPQVLTMILRQQRSLVVFADFAGRIAPMISEINAGNNLILILDHHPAAQVDDPTVFNLDGELFGLKGDRDISASATCFLFADELLRAHGSNASRLSHLGVLGAVGDGFLVDGSLSGVNRTILSTAVGLGLMRVVLTEAGEEYHIRIAEREYPANKICTILDTVGGVGYYHQGTGKGIEICLSGLTPELTAYAEDLIAQRDLVFTKEIEMLKEGINTTGHLQWFDVKDRFQPMGIKMIGVFCTLIKDMDFLDETKYLAGFQHIPDMVPGFGRIQFDSTKISMRVSEYMTERIRAGEIPGLSSFLPEATARLGGFSDACHGLSAATTVRIGQESSLIDEIEHVLKEKGM